jgi:hypothetical protein
MQSIATINQTEQLKNQLNALLPLATTQQQSIAQKFAIDWCFAANHHNTKCLTQAETKMLILHDITAQGKALQSHFDIKNYYRAIQKIEKYAAEGRFLDDLLIKELYLIISETQEMVSKKTNNALTDLVASYKQALVMEINTNTIDLAIDFHQKFMQVKPFPKANHRIAQLLLNFLLMRDNYPPIIIRPTDREGYQHALHEAHKGNKLHLNILIHQRLTAALQLNIKGAQGFNIERINNVEEELSIFKQHLQQQDPPAIVRITPTIAEEHLTASIAPAVELFIKKMRQFDEMYAERKIELRLQFGDIITNHTIQSTREFQHLTLENLEDGIGSIMLDYKLIVFRHNTKKVVNHDATLFVLFNRFDFQIYSPGIQPAFIKRYYEPFTDTEMHELTDNIVKNLLDTVKNSIA